MVIHQAYLDRLHLLSFTLLHLVFFLLTIYSRISSPSSQEIIPMRYLCGYDGSELSIKSIYVISKLILARIHKRGEKEELEDVVLYLYFCENSAKDQERMESIKGRLKLLGKELENELFRIEIIHDTKVGQKKISLMILDIVDRLKINILVLGSMGYKKEDSYTYQQKGLSSCSWTAINNCKCNVMIIREKFQIKLNTVWLVASDASPGSHEALDSVIEHCGTHDDIVIKLFSDYQATRKARQFYRGKLMDCLKKQLLGDYSIVVENTLLGNSASIGTKISEQANMLPANSFAVFLSKSRNPIKEQNTSSIKRIKSTDNLGSVAKWITLNTTNTSLFVIKPNNPLESISES
jgi:hypothetical protein